MLKYLNIVGELWLYQQSRYDVMMMEPQCPTADLSLYHYWQSSLERQQISSSSEHLSYKREKIGYASHTTYEIGIDQEIDKKYSTLAQI